MTRPTGRDPATEIATSSQREGRLLDAVLSLVDSLLHDFDIVELLTQLCERCVELLDVESAALLLADPARNLHLMAATSERTRDLELLQLQADEGPCLDCFATGTTVRVADIAGRAESWPRFVREATSAGVVSVHAVPLRAAGLPLGAMGLFGTSVGELNDADLAVGQALAHIASVAIVQEHAPTPDAVLSQLTSALTSRVVVEQAKGFLHAALDVSIDHAFVLLRRYAATNELHLSQVARTLVTDREQRPDVLEAIARLRSQPLP